MAYEYFIYHKNCMDGMGSAYVAKQNVLTSSATYIPVAHGAPFDETLLETLKGKWVMFSDFIFPQQDMLRIIDVVEKITILDHHKTSLWLLESDVCMKYPNRLHIDIRMEYSGVQLTWMFLNNFGSESLLDKAPWWVSHIADRDLWTWKIPESKSTSTAMYMLNMHRSIDTFSTFITSGKNFFETKGKAMLETINILIRNNAEKANVLPLNIDDYKLRVAVVERTDYVDEVGNELANPEIPIDTKNKETISRDNPVDFVILYSYNIYTQKYGLSFRANGRVDVSAIAKMFGGGGHPNASGCGVNKFYVKDDCLVIEN
jgi:oligoribonuclease NrnB/cAMP/cGMP phosphodiesterase (DHH superfamily)